MTRALSPEFRLVAACCIWPPSERRNRAIRQAASQPLDWGQVLTVVARHRVAGLVHDGLTRAGIARPPELQARLQASASGVARDALRLASEALRLRAMFDEAGIPTLFIKGSPLGQLAYGNIGIKHAWDIDLLVSPGHVADAIELLASAGYERISPPPSLSDDRFKAWTTFAIEAIFCNSLHSTAVELHWRLTDNAVLAPGRGQQVEVAPGRHLATLADNELFSYLCLHGSHHAWGRLKWLADLAAWMSSKTPAEIETLYRYAEDHGAGRSAAQALSLCTLLFGFEIPSAISIETDWITRWLVSAAMAVMAGPEEYLQGSLRIEASQFLLARSMRERWHQLQRRMIGWADFQNVPLPRQLYFLYPVMRVPSWLWRRINRARGRVRQLGT